MLSLRQRPRGAMNGLHYAAISGSAERTLTLLARGVIGIDQGDPEGVTPLMFASFEGFARVVRILLNNGANLSIAADDSFTALHASAHKGHVAVAKILLKAGADVQAVTFAGDNALHLAACRGHSEVMEVLIEAGVDPNSRRLDGATALLMAAFGGCMDAIKLLLRAGSNPLLTSTNSSGEIAVPLDMAAQNGHSDAVSELVRQLGIGGCGGATGGVRALMLAAQDQYVETMATLTSAGVVDTGWALTAAAGYGRTASVRFLLQQHEGNTNRKRAYVNARDHRYTTPVIYTIGFAGSSSVRVVRLLVNAGADTSSTVLTKNTEGVMFNDTPLSFTIRLLREKKIVGKVFAEEQLHSLEAIRRLLLRVEAVHAVSWLWPNDAPSITHAGVKRASKTKTTPTPLTSMLPVLRRRARRSRMLLAPLFRNSKKP